MSKSVISVNNLSKRYRVGLKEKKAETLVGQISQAILSPWENLKRLRQLSRFGEEDESVFWALKNVSFEVKKGEVLGIIGKNGAGKSTLLKILSQITDPTSGKVEIHGRVSSLLEVGTGFHPELSGRENIYMNGTILGMTRREIDSKLDEIIEFSGVEKFIDTPVKFYSSGMKVRLGFSVAAHLDPEILIIDEVLAVGDIEFQHKCLGKIQDVSKDQGRTVIFVSHDLNAINLIARNLIILEKGEIIFKGKTKLGTELFRSNSRALKQNYVDLENKNGINSIEIITSSGNIMHEFGKPLSIIVKTKFDKLYKNIAIAFQFFNENDQSVINPVIAQSSLNWVFNNQGEIELLFPSLRLFKGKYFVTVHLGDKASNEHIETIERVCEFEVSLDNLYSEYGWISNSSIYLEDQIWISKNKRYEKFF